MDVSTAVFAVSYSGTPITGTRALQKERQLNQFLAEVERRALRIAEIGVRNRADALDLVQDAMIKLVHNYSERGQEEWAPLFYRILQNGVRDWHRRQAVRNRVMVWFGRKGSDYNDYDAVAAAPDPIGRTPDEELSNSEAMQHLEAAVHDLPRRQREAFMLRTFEGLDVAGTAVAMGCSQGSVKTHYSRAVHSLREQLEEHRPEGYGPGEGSR
ncbi:MAG: RNA polymerase sigma factor [Gammaproteobacteria bacterium]|nr:RNA polymerase sigma factor [Gammaproteobacteria bacterium]MBU2676146.1 RNA polymerase sigma factor [Gammaproteobacteria bacterium]NNC57042.1 RNA polymerase sigma factor [Woeseiaceae bacterium]NNL49882.1 RNA polymerase sigma factor [Woeseiaceae bacterium]